MSHQIKMPFFSALDQTQSLIVMSHVMVPFHLQTKQLAMTMTAPQEWTCAHQAAIATSHPTLPSAVRKVRYGQLNIGNMCACMKVDGWISSFFFSFWVQKLCHMYFSNEKKKITTFQNVFIVQNFVIMLLVTFKLHQGKGSLTWDTLITSLVMLICKHGFLFLLFQNFASGCRTS